MVQNSVRVVRCKAHILYGLQFCHLELRSADVVFNISQQSKQETRFYNDKMLLLYMYLLAQVHSEERCQYTVYACSWIGTSYVLMHGKRLPT